MSQVKTPPAAGREKCKLFFATGLPYNLAHPNPEPSVHLHSLLLIPVLLSVVVRAEPGEPANPFAGGWGPAPVNGSFRLDDSIVWCGSPVRHDDGRYYLFASRWPRALGMSAWVTNSEIVLASSDKPEGPYRLDGPVLPTRGPAYWDGCATHNPSIHRHNGGYVLFYTGIRYDFPIPTNTPPTRSDYERAWNTKRIGVATAPAPQGPWTRLDHPVLEPRPGEWDAAITSNPAAVIHEDGSVLLLYKSAPAPYPERNQNRRLSFGLARAKTPAGPYERLNPDAPLRISGKNVSVEDPFLWRHDGVYHMIAKAMDGQLVPSYTGFHAWSRDGETWQVSNPPAAYDMTWVWSDGKTETMRKRERPQVLLENGRPAMVFFATTRPDGDIFNTGVRVLPPPER